MAVKKYGAPPPRSDGPDLAPGPSADVEDGSTRPPSVLDITVPTQGGGDDGAEVEGDGGPPRQEATDGPVGQDHGDSAPEPTPADGKGPGTSSAGPAAVAAPAVPGLPSLTVSLAIEFLLETPDYEVMLQVAGPQLLRMLASWCQRNLAARGFEGPPRRLPRAHRQHAAVARRGQERGVMAGCCNEHGCRRKKPIMPMRSGLTGTWYVVTDYTNRGEGRYEAKTKHALSPDQAAQLDAMREALAASTPGTVA